MLELNQLDLDEIATALSDQTDYDHRWLIDPESGRVGFWTSDTGLDGENPVEAEDVDLTPIDPLPSYVWYQDMTDFADRVGDEAEASAPGLYSHTSNLALSFALVLSYGLALVLTGATMRELGIVAASWSQPTTATSCGCLCSTPKMWSTPTTGPQGPSPPWPSSLSSSNTDSARPSGAGIRTEPNQHRRKRISPRDPDPTPPGPSAPRGCPGRTAAMKC